MKVFWVGIKLSAMNNQLFWKWRYLIIKFRSGMEIKLLLINCSISVMQIQQQNQTI